MEQEIYYEDYEVGAERVTIGKQSQKPMSSFTLVK